MSPGIYKGYSYIYLSNKGQLKNTIHRLVAVHFIPNPDNLPLVCHKLETLDKKLALYNGEDNLFWGTHKDNSQDRENKGRSNNHFINKNPNKGKFGKDNCNSKKVNQYTKEGIFIKTWYGMREIEKHLLIPHGNISLCCNGKGKTAGGFIWKYS